MLGFKQSIYQYFLIIVLVFLNYWDSAQASDGKEIPENCIKWFKNTEAYKDAENCEQKCVTAAISRILAKRSVILLVMNHARKI